MRLRTTNLDKPHSVAGQDAAIGDCGIVNGATIFLVDPNQPASWRRQVQATSEHHDRMTATMGGQESIGLQEHGKAQQEENPVRGVRACMQFLHSVSVHVRKFPESVLA